MRRRVLALVGLFLAFILLLSACGGTEDEEDIDFGAVITPAPTPAPTPASTPTPQIDPYDAVKNYWSKDQLVQEWGPAQVVEHLFFHPVIAYPTWAFEDCKIPQSQREGLDADGGGVQQNPPKRL